MKIPHAVWRVGENRILTAMGTQRAMKSAIKKRIIGTLLIDQEQSTPFLPLIKKGNQDKATSKNSFLLLKKEPTSKLHKEKYIYINN